MGQTYTVEAKFIFKNNDPESFCKVFRDEIKSRDGVTAIFLPYEEDDLKTPFGLFKILTSNNAMEAYDSNGDKNPDIWVSDFDASYGWEGLMYDIFSSVLKECDNGSYVRIWPDHGQTKITVKNGKVKIR